MSMNTRLCISAVLFTLAMPFLSFSNASQEDLTLVMENAWRNAFRQESKESDRIIRFTGFVEGLLRIQAPATWRESAFRFMDEEDTVILEKKVNEEDRLVIRTTESANRYNAQLLSPTGEEKWKLEPFDIFPHYYAGPSGLQVEAIVDKDRIILFGRIAEANFVDILSTSKGEVLLHFGFIADRELNFGKRRKE